MLPLLTDTSGEVDQALAGSSFFVESRPAHITTREGNEIQLDGHASSRTVFPQFESGFCESSLNKASPKDDFLFI